MLVVCCYITFSKLEFITEIGYKLAQMLERSEMTFVRLTCHRFWEMIGQNLLVPVALCPKLSIRVQEMFVGE